MLNSVEQRIIAEWCYRGQKEAERWRWWCAGAWRGSRPCCWWCRTDSPDPRFASDRCPTYLRVAIDPRGKLSFFAFTLCCPHRWFLWPVDLLPSTWHRLLYIALVSAADHLQYLSRSHAAMCAKQNGFCRRAKNLHTRIISIKLGFSKENGSLGILRSFGGFGTVLKGVSSTFLILEFWLGSWGLFCCLCVKIS